MKEAGYDTEIDDSSLEFRSGVNELNLDYYN